MSSTDTLAPHQSLTPDQALRSQNGRAVLLLQSDGNLVLYVDGRAMWGANTVGRAPGQAVMQGDGNFVVYDAAGQAAWASATAGHDGALLTVQDDGNCVVYHNGRPLWATNTAQDAPVPLAPPPRPTVDPQVDEQGIVPDPRRPAGGLEMSCADSSIRTGLPRLSLPERGAFQFPHPYGTTGFRITNPSDGELLPRSYSYWRQTNNHAGAGSMLVFAGISGIGPVLFNVDKRNGRVEKIGPLFEGTPLRGATGEGMYFSARDPHVIYCALGSRMMRYHVEHRTLSPVFDASEHMGRRVALWQMHSSYDDRTHSATVRDAETGADLGACVFREHGGRFTLIERRGDYDECQIDKSGQWLVIKENVDGRNGEDNRIIQVDSLAERIFLDEAGAAGHSDNGFGYMVSEDNWHPKAAAVRVWNLSDLGAPPAGMLVYHTTEWGAGVGHVSHANAHPSLPVAQQWAWVSNATDKAVPRANEILLIPLDGSLQVIAVAPNLVTLTGNLYDDLPKGNCDLSGEYFVWLGSPNGRRDLFMVHAPRR
jgi:hypothetical protein